MCNLHYRRKMRHDDPHKRLIRNGGEGTPHIDGYWAFERNGVVKLRHVLVAERALGKPLPSGAVVHHIDEDRSNDAASNLVICPNAAYHQLLHVRMRALNACGHADWRKCHICKQYDEPKNLKFYKTSGNIVHAQCRRLRDQARRTA